MKVYFTPMAYVAAINIAEDFKFTNESNSYTKILGKLIKNKYLKDTKAVELFNYCQIGIEETSKSINALSTPSGLYELDRISKLNELMSEYICIANDISAQLANGEIK